jgi:hypothetical protein
LSSNFLDISGHFAGVDLHVYYTPAGVPVPNVHVVEQLHLLGRPWRIVLSVTTGHCPVLQSNWAMLVVPHVPIPIPPHPVAEGVNLATIILTASSAPQLSAHSVTGKGEALLTAIVSAFGANSDCGIQIAPTNVDVNLNSVKTTPSMGDYYAAATGMLLNGLYNAATGVLNIPNPGSIGIAISQNLFDITGIPILDPYTWVINKITSLVQTVVDR